MNGFFIPHIPPPPRRAGPAQGVAQAELRAMLAEMKAQRLEEQVTALNAQLAYLKDELHAKNNLLSLFSYGSHWDATSLPDYRVEDVPEVDTSEDFPDLSNLGFSAAVQRILGIPQQAAPPSLPSSDESNAVVDLKKTDNRRRRQQQRNGGDQASRKVVDEKVLERREKQLQKAKDHPVYQRYAAEVPRSERKPADPQTPNKARAYSRRDFDNRVRNWKKSLHRWEERFDAATALTEDVVAMALCNAFEDFDLISYDMEA
ncbi:stem loop binding protein 2 [Aphelenchoides avenae]|nr:stem loop binding protein 2 [Aphelenchus avenae]KAH7715176.1 stem loop binding protein 2 [Aphelenchus avenae]